MESTGKREEGGPERKQDKGESGSPEQHLRKKGVNNQEEVGKDEALQWGKQAVGARHPKCLG